MGRNYQDYHVPKGVVNIVRAVCCDYYRRRMMISQREVQGAVLNEYTRLNGAIDGALVSIEEVLRDAILSNVTDGVGYDKSFAACIICKNSFYNRRNKFVHDVAVALNFM